LEQVQSPIGSLASQFAATNLLEEGISSGDFGDTFPDYRWNSEVLLLTNGFYEVYLNVTRSGQSRPDTELIIQLYRPQQGAGRGPLQGGGRRR
jgi:hypothetical protein